MVIKDEDFKDVAKAVGKGVKTVGKGLGIANRAARNFVNKAKDTYDFYSGRRDSKYNFTDDASDSDLRKTDFKPYVGKFKYKAKKDEKSQVIQLTFDARAVDKNFANRVRPDHNRSDSLYPFVRDYKDHIVTMELPMKDSSSRSKKKSQKKESVNPDAKEFYLVSDSGAVIYIYKEDGEWHEDFIKGDLYGEPTSYMGYLSPREIQEWVNQDYPGERFRIVSAGDYEQENIEDYEESVMTPTPVPYKGYQCDKDGKLIKEGHEEVLDETPGLTMSSPEIIHDGKEDFEGHLEIQINGKTYKYKMKPGTGKLPAEIAGTVSKMQEFSDGKALAYLKKNMELTETLKEDLLQSDEQVILKSVKDKYGVVSSPCAGPSFILPSGEFLDIKGKVKNHADVERWLVSQELSPYEDIGSTQGSPSLKQVGCIRVDTPKYYIQLPPDNITSSQYSSLRDWIDFLVTCNVPYLEVIAPGISPVKYYFDNDVDSKYIVGRIRRYYISGSLYEQVVTEKTNPFKSHHICQGCGKPLSQCTCEVQEEDIDLESLEEGLHLGDEVTWQGQSYIIVDDNVDEDGLVILRPLDKFSKEDFDDPESGDSSEDVYLSPSQLKECTQPSNIGQHKSDSIDLIENDEDSQEE